MLSSSIRGPMFTFSTAGISPAAAMLQLTRPTYRQHYHCRYRSTCSVHYPQIRLPNGGFGLGICCWVDCGKRMIGSLVSLARFQNGIQLNVKAWAKLRFYQDCFVTPNHWRSPNVHLVLGDPKGPGKHWILIKLLF